jgi:heme exporter protein D
MDKLITYLDMGGYAAWVWPSYGLAILALIGTLAITLRTLKSRQQEFDELKSLRRAPNENGSP